MTPSDIMTFLFVPANRPERIEKAARAGAHAIIIDLEDAVAAPEKARARQGLARACEPLGKDTAVFLRINGITTPWYDEDLRIAAELALSGIVVPKAEDEKHLSALKARLQPDQSLIAIIETAKGLASSDEVAMAADRIAFGSVDFCADLKCVHEREALLFARSRLVLSARLADKPAPIDGVTLSIHDEAAIEDDARHAANLGFAGKLLIHPGQVEPAKRGLAPSDADHAWALNILASGSQGSAMSVDGAMVDAPVLERAKQIVRMRQRLFERETQP